MQCSDSLLATCRLRVDSDAAYLVLNSAKSCIAKYFYCTANPHALNYNCTLHNAPILIEYWALKHVVCSAAQAEYGALFHHSEGRHHTFSTTNPNSNRQQDSKLLCACLHVHPVHQILGHEVALAEGGSNAEGP
eukprot:14636567-Ditylum_brightwellii.AAC.1